jgi:IclR family transcriptional regulator, acetate operon repressor
MRVNNDSDDRSVLGRVLSILDVVAQDAGEVGLSELARRTGLKKPTVHRLATEMVRYRLLDRGAYGYRLGFHLFELGHRVQVSRALRDIALPFMEDLYEISHEIVQLAVLDGADVVCLEKLTGHRSYEAPAWVGGRQPAHCTALGKAILSRSPEVVVERVIAAGLPRRTHRSVTDPAAFRAELARVRDEGVAFDMEEGVREISCVAAPVCNSEGLPIVALSIAGPSYRIPVGRLAGAVRASALALSRALDSHSSLQDVPRRHQRVAEAARFSDSLPGSRSGGLVVAERQQHRTQ